MRASDHLLCAPFSSRRSASDQLPKSVREYLKKTPVTKLSFKGGLL